MTAELPWLRQSIKQGEELRILLAKDVAQILTTGNTKFKKNQEKNFVNTTPLSKLNQLTTIPIYVSPWKPADFVSRLSRFIF